MQSLIDISVTATFAALVEQMHKFAQVCHCFCNCLLPLTRVIFWGLDTKWVASSGRVPKGPGSIPGGASVGHRWNFVNIDQFRFHPMLKYACVSCVWFVLIN